MRVCQACDRRFASVEWTCPACQWKPARHGSVYQMMSVVPSDVGFSAEYFDHLATVEMTHFWFVARNALITWALTRYFPDARTFLDVGCGNGQVLAALRRSHPELRLTGSEAFLEGLLFAARRVPEAELMQADARALPFEAEFDVVGSFDVLEHIADDRLASRELAKAVRPGGGVIVAVPQHPFLWGPPDAYAKHERRYSRRALVGLLEQAGLRIERVTSFVSLLLPALFLSRLAQRAGHGDPRGEHNISPTTNRVGLQIMNLERALIERGASLPAGGSLLAIARRPS